MPPALVIVARHLGRIWASSEDFQSPLGEADRDQERDSQPGLMGVNTAAHFSGELVVCGPAQRNFCLVVIDGLGAIIHIFYTS